MTINDQIRDEKLQYDINRKAAKISALSSGKIDKYEYLTSKEILPSNQSQIIEQAKFTYSPLGKAFEKYTKTIEDQGQKQVDALKDLRPEEQTKAIAGKSKKIFNRLLEKKQTDEIQKESKETDFNNLVYYVKGSNIAPINFIRFRGPLHIFNEIKNVNTSLKKVEKDLKMFTSSLDEITSGDPKYKSDSQSNAIKNTAILYNSR